MVLARRAQSTSFLHRREINALQFIALASPGMPDQDLVFRHLLQLAAMMQTSHLRVALGYEAPCNTHSGGAGRLAGKITQSPC